MTEDVKDIAKRLAELEESEGKRPKRGAAPPSIPCACGSWNRRDRSVEHRCLPRTSAAGRAAVGNCIARRVPDRRGRIRNDAGRGQRRTGSRHTC